MARSSLVNHSQEGRSLHNTTSDACHSHPHPQAPGHYKHHARLVLWKYFPLPTKSPMMDLYSIKSNKFPFLGFRFDCELITHFPFSLNTHLLSQPFVIPLMHIILSNLYNFTHILLTQNVGHPPSLSHSASQDFSHILKPTLNTVSFSRLP